MGIQVKMIQSDNTGENKALQKALEGKEFNISFQYTATGTPQQNNRVKQKFATLYSKVCSRLNLSRMNKGLQRQLWAEYSSHVTNMENIIL